LKRFENRVVLVTGGGGGIGSETCRRFAAEGARVAVADMNLASAQAVADHLAASGAQALAVACDITQRAQVDLAIAKVESELGAIDVLVNNAGWDVFKPFTKTVESEWERLISINLVGALHMHHAVLPSMVQRRAGRIINIASDAARVGSSGEAVYAACKGGLVSFSKTIAREHARHGITVNVVCPGPTQTALITSRAPATQKSCWKPFSAPFRWAELVSPVICRARFCFLPATTPAMSPDRSSVFPVASP
jgi:2-hydroxycyclohexanecarboxyl-CoA dehydrogenase